GTGARRRARPGVDAGASGAMGRIDRDQQYRRAGAGRPRAGMSGAGVRPGGRAGPGTMTEPAPDPEPPGDIGVLVVDDHAVVRRGLAAYLESAEGVEVLAEAVDGKDAIDQLRRLATEG